MVSSIHSYTDLLYDDSLTSLKYATFHSYLTVDEAQDTKYFYWFAECDGCDAATAPVALWTNGGPGCSGLLGFMTEQGPLRPNGDGTLAQNPYAWNKVANYLFVEQPVGVGFSYSTTPAAYRDVGDDQAAALNYQLILQFLAKFPEYAPNEFYISAESYGGHYMPTLAKYIAENDPSRSKINFQVPSSVQFLFLSFTRICFKRDMVQALS